MNPAYRNARERAELDRTRCTFVSYEGFRCLLEDRPPHESHLIEYKDGRRFTVTPEPEEAVS